MLFWAKPGLFAAAAAIAIVIMTAIVSFEHRLTPTDAPKPPPASVDDDPDPMVRAQKLCKLMQNMPAHRTGDAAYRDATDALCEEQKEEAARLQHR